jgi:sigma-B regulation protein RsbU (phosphoserine phosphatase)
MAAPSVRRRLVFSFLVILGLGALNEAISLWSDHARAEAFRTLDRTLRRQSLIASISQDLGNLHKEVSLLGEIPFDPRHPPEPELRRTFALRLAKVARDIGDLGRSGGPIDAHASDTLANLFGQLSTSWTEFYENLGVETGWSVAFLARADPVAQRLLLAFLPRLEAQGTRQAELARSEYDAVAVRTRSLIAVIFVLSAAIGIVVAFQVSRYLVGRLAVLRHGADLIGEVNLQHRIPEEPCDELGDLASHFNDMAERLDVAQEKLRGANRELAEVNQILSQRIEEELAKVRLAARIQRDLLPQSPPAIPGYDIAGRSIPAQTVGGDYFDFLPLDERRIAMCVGDVSGKGLPASLLMANLQAAVRSQVLARASVSECLRRTNTLLYRSTDPGKFVTAFYAVLDFARGELCFSNAGHNPPLLFRGDGAAERLEVGGIVLGIMEDSEFQEGSRRLERGDLLVIYSDGVTEAMDANGEEFGEQGLAAVIRRSRAESAAEVLNAIVEAALEFSGDRLQTDDITLIVLKRL